ncbi:hypothetical protein [Streptomyces sp. NPDC050504]|uniref:hypothetical protein n=1 Tax=Streptomyces sp. NPDC050504 TaxID=3365618 RepID=UPI0037918A29
MHTDSPQTRRPATAAPLAALFDDLPRHRRPHTPPPPKDRAHPDAPARGEEAVRP